MSISEHVDKWLYILSVLILSWNNPEGDRLTVDTARNRLGGINTLLYTQGVPRFREIYPTYNCII